jgi:hypothetical protein
MSTDPVTVAPGEMSLAFTMAPPPRELESDTTPVAELGTA